MGLAGIRWTRLLLNNPSFSSTSTTPTHEQQQQQQEPSSSSPLARDPLAGVVAAAIQVGLVGLFS